MFFFSDDSIYKTHPFLLQKHLNKAFETIWAVSILYCLFVSHTCKVWRMIKLVNSDLCRICIFMLRHTPEIKDKRGDTMRSSRRKWQKNNEIHTSWIVQLNFNMRNTVAGVEHFLNILSTLQWFRGTLPVPQSNSIIESPHSFILYNSVLLAPKTPALLWPSGQLRGLVRVAHKSLVQMKTLPLNQRWKTKETEYSLSAS